MKINPDSTPELSSGTQHLPASQMHGTASDRERAGGGLDGECLKGEGTEKEGSNAQDKVSSFTHCSDLLSASSGVCPGRESTQTWFVLGPARHLYTRPGSTPRPTITPRANKISLARPPPT